MFCQSMQPTCDHRWICVNGNHRYRGDGHHGPARTSAQHEESSDSKGLLVVQ